MGSGLTMHLLEQISLGHYEMLVCVQVVHIIIRFDKHLLFSLSVRQTLKTSLTSRLLEERQ